MSLHAYCRGWTILAGVKVACPRCHPDEYRQGKLKTWFVDGTEATEARIKYRKAHGIPLDAKPYTRGRKP